MCPSTAEPGYSRLAQPEPVTGRMFGKPLPAGATCQLQTDIRAYLLAQVGQMMPLTQFYRYERLDTADVQAQYATMQQQSEAGWKVPSTTVEPVDPPAMPASRLVPTDENVPAEVKASANGDSSGPRPA